LRLTAGLASAPSLPEFPGSGECTVEDMVRLEAIKLRDKGGVAVIPPATLRCSFAEAVVHWVRDGMALAVKSLGAAPKAIDNHAAFECRGRNRVVGAKMSEHGKGNALDLRSIRLSDGTIIGLADPKAPKELRESLRRSACEHFTTVLGPGSDGYHENHIHIDLAERRRGHRICQWDVREPEPAPSAEPIPLPRPRPAAAK
jgi:hypothetical protein